MKTFSQLLSEVAQPKSEDEINFKAKHEIDVMDHPESEETQHSSMAKTKPRKADYRKGEDMAVYEAKLDPVNKKALKGDWEDREDKDIDNDGDTDQSDIYLHKRRQAVTKAIKNQKDLGEAVNSKTFFDVVKKLRNASNDAASIASNASRERNVTPIIIDDLRDDIQALHNDLGYMIDDLKKIKLKENLDEVSFDLAKRARDKGFEKMAKSIGTTKTTQYGTKEYVPASDAEMKNAEKGARQAKLASRAMNRALNKKRTGKYESASLSENFKAGMVELNDGSKVNLKKQDADLLNQMFKDLNATNKKQMMKVAMTDEDGFEEILGFAREAL